MQMSNLLNVSRAVKNNVTDINMGITFLINTPAWKVKLAFFVFYSKWLIDKQSGKNNYRFSVARRVSMSL